MPAIAHSFSGCGPDMQEISAYVGRMHGTMMTTQASWADSFLAKVRLLGKVFRIRAGLQRIAISQSKGIHFLRDNPATQGLAPETYAEIANELIGLVQLVDEMIADCKDLPYPIPQLCAPSLRKLGDGNEYILSIAESFQVASDAECETLLAIALETVAS